ncbi:hypothetical protein ZWY2020_045868 [Hordeum vulgare]|nr:hypothetical protein ZWY2020_045868 [Hordeum vulgare]
MLVRGLGSVAASLAQLFDTLTAAHKVTMDSTGGSFLPSLFMLHGTQDYNQQRPSQELVAKDLHDTELKFRHIYRG